MTMRNIQIWLISYLQPNKMVAENSLPYFCDSKVKVRGIIEGYTKIPSDIHKSWDVPHHINEIWHKY